MSLDEFMPAFDVSMRHGMEVRASPAAAYEALRQADLSKSWLVSALFCLRGLARTRRGAPADFLEAVQRGGFVRLAERPPHEVAFGVAGKFWLPSGGRVDGLTRESFLAFTTDGFAKAAWSISFEAKHPGLTQVATETRVQCLGSHARRCFRVYWTFVRPFSGVIRRVLLRQIKRQAERTR